MTPSFFKRLLKAYLLAVVAFTMTSMPDAAARVLQSADQPQSGVTVPDIPQAAYKELEGRITRLESGIGKSPSSPIPLLWPKGCSNATDTSQKCQQAKEYDQQVDVFSLFFLLGGWIVILIILFLCPKFLCKPGHEPPQAPTTSAGPSQEMVSVSKIAGSRWAIGQAIKQGDPNAVALNILERMAGQQATSWHEDYMHWADPTKHGAASVGASVIIVFYSPVLTHEAADKLCHIIWGIRDAAQNDVGNSMPLKQEHTVYGALAGLLLSTDAKDVQQLVEKCRRHGLFIWVPSGCWLEGSKQAVIAAP